MDDAFVQQFANVFLGEASIYKMENYVKPTKHMLELKIKAYQEELDTKAYDPEKLGLINGVKIDEKLYRQQLEDVIKALKEQALTAPAIVKCETVRPLISTVDEYGNTYIAAKDNGMKFDYSIQNLNGIQMNISQSI